MMMTFVNMDAPGITILPTHRVVHGLENFSSPDFITKASAYFDITELPTPPATSHRPRQHHRHRPHRRHRRRQLPPHRQTRGHRRRARQGDRPFPPVRPSSTSSSSTPSSSTSSSASIRTPSPASATSSYIREADEAVALVAIRRSRHRLPHQTHHPRPAQRHLPRRRSHAPEIHRLLPQTPQRPRHLRPRLRFFRIYRSRDSYENPLTSSTQATPPSFSPYWRERRSLRTQTE